MPTAVRPSSSTDDPSIAHRPPTGEANAIHMMMRVVGFAETIRLIPRAQEAGASVETFNEALSGLARLGVARHIRPLDVPATPAMLERASGAILSALENSPVPEAEWTPLSETLGDGLAGMLEISPSSVARYRSGERATPDLVAARLHVLAMIVSDLAGSYNEFGVRRWFQRPRTALQGRAPNEILSHNWSCDADDVSLVRDLARSLLGAALA